MLLQENTTWKENASAAYTVGTYNPNGFRVDGVTQRVKKEQKLQTLLDVLLSDMPDPNRPIDLVYMFYDVADGLPTICRDDDYHESMKRHVRVVTS